MFPSAEYDNWKATEPDEQPAPAPTKVNTDYVPHDIRKLSYRFVEEAIDYRALRIVDEWLEEIEGEWRKSNDQGAIRQANSLRWIRESQIRN